MNSTIRRAAAMAIAALTVLLVAAACGGSDPEDLTFDVTIHEDAWDVEGDIIKVKQGDHVTVTVNSDVKGGFHLHGYDLYNEVAPGEPMTFDFTADATGNFGITLHKFSLASDAASEEAGHADDVEHTDEGETELELGSIQVFPR